MINIVRGTEYTQFIDNQQRILEYKISSDTFSEDNIESEKKHIINFKISMYLSDPSYKTKCLLDTIHEIVTYYEMHVPSQSSMDNYRLELNFFFPDYKVLCEKSENEFHVYLYKEIGKNTYKTDLFQTFEQSNTSSNDTQKEKIYLQTYQYFASHSFRDFLEQGRKYLINPSFFDGSSLVIYTDEDNVVYQMRESLNNYKEQSFRDEIGVGIDSYYNLSRIFMHDSKNAICPVKDFDFEKGKSKDVDFTYRLYRFHEDDLDEVHLSDILFKDDQTCHFVIFPDGYTYPVRSVDVRSFTAREQCKLDVESEEYKKKNSLLPGSLRFNGAYFPNYDVDEQLQTRVLSHLTREQMKYILKELVENRFVDLRTLDCDFADQRTDQLSTKWTKPIYYRPTNMIFTK